MGLAVLSHESSLVTWLMFVWVGNEKTPQQQRLASHVGERTAVSVVGSLVLVGFSQDFLTLIEGNGRSTVRQDFLRNKQNYGPARYFQHNWACKLVNTSPPKNLVLGRKCLFDMDLRLVATKCQAPNPLYIGGH